MSKKKKGKVAVTDHAIVRYLQRVYGLDIEQVKNEIVDENVRSLLKSLKIKSGQLPAKTHVVRMTDGVVKTVIESKHKKVSKNEEDILSLFEGGSEEE